MRSAISGNAENGSDGWQRSQYQASERITKKKPEIARSRAKSTKGGGWRRQPWHVVATLRVLPLRFGVFTAPLRFQHPCTNISRSFCATQDVFWKFFRAVIFVVITQQ